MTEYSDGWEGMTKCPHCGSYNAEDNIFCEWCSQRIRWITNVTVEEKPEEAPDNPVVAYVSDTAPGGNPENGEYTGFYQKWEQTQEEEQRGFHLPEFFYDTPEKIEKRAKRRAKMKAAGKAIVTKAFVTPARAVSKSQKISATQLICWHCRTESPAGATYCCKCGSLLDPGEKRSTYCCFCGKVNGWNAVYCHACGKKLPRDHNDNEDHDDNDNNDNNNE